MVDLSERENGLWRRERGDRASTEYTPQSEVFASIFAPGALRIFAGESKTIFLRLWNLCF